MFKIEFYETETGKIPVKDFLIELPLHLRTKATQEINLLQELGNELREPYSKHIKNGVFELRVKFSNDIARIFYFFFVGEKIILTNGFIKKTQKTPTGEIEKALKYKKDYERRKK